MRPVNPLRATHEDSGAERRSRAGLHCVTCAILVHTFVSVARSATFRRGMFRIWYTFVALTFLSRGRAVSRLLRHPLTRGINKYSRHTLTLIKSKVNTYEQWRSLVIRHDRQYRPKQSGLNCLLEAIPNLRLI
jgi:hypothetical protein